MAAITLILHNIRSTHNVGSIFRTAEGLGVAEIIISGYTPYPLIQRDKRLPHISKKLTEQIHKTALGAEMMVPFRYYSDLLAALENIQLPIVALEQSNVSIPISQYQPPPKFALLLGEEVRGIEKQYLEKCDAIVEIPMSGKKESFNVSVAAAIALYAFTST